MDELLQELAVTATDYAGRDGFDGSKLMDLDRDGIRWRLDPRRHGR